MKIATVTNVNSRTGGITSDEWEITVTRGSWHGAPPASDLPPDIRKAIGDWLATADEQGNP